MTESVSCGEATIKLLERYGVDTVFGIPGVHTLDFCRGLAGSSVRHVQARNEQGAGFMADGYARTSGKPGVALVISGPGVTNAATPLGQSYADSIPVLLISSEASGRSIGKGWGVLHEVTEQKAVTAPLTALSATARAPQDVPDLMAQAFSIFSSERPRPVHISIPIDVLAQPVSEEWVPVSAGVPAHPDGNQVELAAGLLAEAETPVIMVGGGAVGAREDLIGLTEKLNAVVIASTAGKGIVPDSHPLSLGGSTVRPEVQEFIAGADVVLAVGTELAETDSFVERLPINGSLIRADIDASKINDLYPATVGIVGDAGATLAELNRSMAALGPAAARLQAERTVSDLRRAISLNLSRSEQQHKRLLQTLRATSPEDTIFAGDICQLVYTGAFAMPVELPRLWHYPAGFCTLGCGLPNGIGAKLALPDRPVVVLAGDGGFMFTGQELVCAAELNLSLPVILWENGGLKQIQDDMNARQIPLVGVEGMNPEFRTLAEACHCKSSCPDSLDAFADAVAAAFEENVPTIIVVTEDQPWLT